VSRFKKFRHRLKLDRKSLLAILPLRWRLMQRYRQFHGEWYFPLRPQTFSQKIFYNLLHDRRPLLVTFADKLAAREYVRKKIGGDFLVELLAVTDDPEQIPFERLPTRFVLKTNHGSGFVRLVRDKAQEDWPALRQMCTQWLATRYGEQTFEWIYAGIEPKIMVETFLEGSAGEAAFDYKFFVFHGKVFTVHVDMKRPPDTRRDYFSTDWQRLDVRCRFANSDSPLPRPAKLEQMIALAERLGAETDFVRVDFYIVGERIYFGELTNYPGVGCRTFDPKSFDAELGAQWRANGR
jgi:TupA-like ATPgrasp